MMAPESDSWYWKRSRLPSGLRPRGFHHAAAAAAAVAAVGAVAAPAWMQSSRAAASVNATRIYAAQQPRAPAAGELLIPATAPLRSCE